MPEATQEIRLDDRVEKTRQPLRLLHLAPAPILERYGAGNWKDLQGRRILFNELGIECPLIGFGVDDPSAVIPSIDFLPTDIMLEYSARPDFMQALCQQFPETRIHLRMHNAEAFQHWHRLSPTWIPTKQNLRSVYGTVRLAWLDRKSVEIAHSRFGISEWDNENYWRWLSRKPMKHLPYFCPWPWLQPEIANVAYENRPHQIICMPGGGDRLSQQQTRLFDKVAGMIQTADLSTKREFLLSKGLLGSSTSPLDNAKRIDIAEPWKILTESRAVAVLTDLGFGMKTTIIDGLAAGAHVLVHSGLINRLPEAIANAVVPVDVNLQNLGRILAERLSKPPEDATINLKLMRQAKTLMSGALQLPSESQPSSTTIHAR